MRFAQTHAGLVVELQNKRASTLANGGHRMRPQRVGQIQTLEKRVPTARAGLGELGVVERLLNEGLRGLACGKRERRRTRIDEQADHIGVARCDGVEQRGVDDVGQGGAKADRDSGGCQVACVDGVPEFDACHEASSLDSALMSSGRLLDSMAPQRASKSSEFSSSV